MHARFAPAGARVGLFLAIVAVGMVTRVLPARGQAAVPDATRFSVPSEAAALSIETLWGDGGDHLVVAAHLASDRDLHGILLSRGGGAMGIPEPFSAYT